MNRRLVIRREYFSTDREDYVLRLYWLAKVFEHS